MSSTEDNVAALLRTYFGGRPGWRGVQFSLSSSNITGEQVINVFRGLNGRKLLLGGFFLQVPLSQTFWQAYAGLEPWELLNAVLTRIEKTAAQELGYWFLADPPQDTWRATLGYKPIRVRVRPPKRRRRQYR